MNKINKNQELLAVLIYLKALLYFTKMSDIIGLNSDPSHLLNEYKRK